MNTHSSEKSKLSSSEQAKLPPKHSFVALQQRYKSEDRINNLSKHNHINKVVKELTDQNFDNQYLFSFNNTKNNSVDQSKVQTSEKFANNGLPFQESN